jgi:hypothetical protein
MKATVKKDAHKIFARKVNARTRPDMPWTDDENDYYETLKSLSGKKLKVERKYGSRVHLKYDKPKKVNGMTVVGIDLERDLVKMHK